MNAIAVAAVVAVAWLLSGCGGGQRTSTPASGNPAATPSSPASRTLTFDLAPLNGSGYSGSAQVVTSAGGYTVSLTLSGLRPGTAHVVNFHSGTCANIDTSREGGPSVVADSGGHATVQLEYHGDYAVPASGRVLTVHGDVGTAGDLEHFACGQLPQ